LARTSFEERNIKCVTSSGHMFMDSSPFGEFVTKVRRSHSIQTLNVIIIERDREIDSFIKINFAAQGLNCVNYYKNKPQSLLHGVLD
jgi:hypothetical protein